jgi:hypothetical protein
MSRSYARTWLAFVSLLVVTTGAVPLAGQDTEGSLAAGAYRSGSKSGSSDGLGVELAGRLVGRSGIGFGLGARVIRYDSGKFIFTFFEARFAPVPSPSSWIQPILGARAGPFIYGGESGVPFAGLEGGVFLGIGARAWPGVSVTFAGDVALILNAGVFIPGLQGGITLHYSAPWPGVCDPDV